MSYVFCYRTPLTMDVDTAAGPGPRRRSSLRRWHRLALSVLTTFCLAGFAAAEESKAPAPAAKAAVAPATGEAAKRPARAASGNVAAATREGRPRAAKSVVRAVTREAAPKAAKSAVRAATRERAKPKAGKPAVPAATGEAKKKAPQPGKPKTPPKPKSPWQFHPSLNTNVAYDETVTPREGGSRDPVDTFVTTVAPGLQLRRQSGPEVFDLRYTFAARFYEELKERDSMNHSLAVTWSRRPSKNWGWRLSDRLTYLEDTGGAADESVTQLTTYTDNAATIDTDYRFAEKWKLLAGMTHQVREFDDPFRQDWYTLAPAWGLEYAPTPPHRWTFRHEYKYLDIDDAQTERTHRVLAGYGTTLPWKLNLDLRAGVLVFEDVGEADPAAEIRLYRRWEPARVNFLYERTSSVSTGTSDIIRRDYAAFTPVWIINTETDLIGTFSWLLQESLNAETVDITTLRSGVTLRRKFATWLTGYVSYTYVDQNARAMSGLSLHGSIIAVGLNARF